MTAASVESFATAAAVAADANFVAREAETLVPPPPPSPPTPPPNRRRRTRRLRRDSWRWITNRPRADAAIFWAAAVAVFTA